MTQYRNRVAIIGSNINEKGVSIRTRPSERFRETAPPEPHDGSASGEYTNKGHIRCMANNLYEPNSDQSLVTRLAKSGSNGQASFAWQSQTDFDASLDSSLRGCGGGQAWKAHQHVATNDSGDIRKPCAVEDNSGDLWLFYQSGTSAYRRRYQLGDTSFGAVSVFDSGDSALPTAALHRATGRIVVAMTDVDKSQIKFYKHDDGGSWTAVDFTLPKFKDDIYQGLYMVSQRRAGSEDFYLVAINDGGAKTKYGDVFTVYKSEDLGESWDKCATSGSGSFLDYAGFSLAGSMHCTYGEGAMCIMEKNGTEYMLFSTTWYSTVGPLCKVYMWYSVDGETWHGMLTTMEASPPWGGAYDQNRLPAIIQGNQNIQYRPPDSFGSSGVADGLCFIFRDYGSNLNLYQCNFSSHVTPEAIRIKKNAGSAWWHSGYRITHSDGGSQVSMKDPHLALWRGRPVLFYVIDDSVNTEDHLYFCESQTWTNAPERMHYTYNYIPGMGLPVTNLGWLLDDAGAPSASVSSGVLTLGGVAGDKYAIQQVGAGYDYSDNTLLGGGVKLRFALSVDAGTDEFLAIRTQLAGNEVGVEAYLDLSLYVSETGFRFHDNITFTDMADVTIDMTTAREFILSFGGIGSDGETDPRACVWYREFSGDDENFASQSGVPQVAHAELDSYLRWGICNTLAGGETVNVNWYYMQFAGSNPGSYSADGMFSDELWDDSVPKALIAKNGARICSHNRQYLTEGVEICWTGGNGIAGDLWDVDTRGRHRIENIFTNHPRAVWQTADLETLQTIIAVSEPSDGLPGFLADAVGLFGTNFRQCTVAFTETPAPWASRVEVALDATVAAAVYNGPTSASDYEIELTGTTVYRYPTIPPCDSTLATSQWMHRFNNLYLMMTSGNAYGYVYKIQVSTADVGAAGTIRCTMAGGLSPKNQSALAGDTCVIFTDRMVGMANLTTYPASDYKAYPYMRITIPAQQTYEGRFQIAKSIVGRSFYFSQSPGFPRGAEMDYNVDVVEGRGGFLDANGVGDQSESWGFGIDGLTYADKETAKAFLKYIGGAKTLVAFCPIMRVPPSKDAYPDVMNEARLSRVIGTLKESRMNAAEVYEITDITFKEVLW